MARAFQRYASTAPSEDVHARSAGTTATRSPDLRADEVSRHAVRLVVMDRAGAALGIRPFAALPELLRAGDLVVVNDAATLPASFAATTCAGDRVEIRLAGPLGGRTWSAVVFGAGDWRTRTEQRPAPRAVRPGCRLEFAGLAATVSAVSTVSDRLVTLAFEDDEERLWSALYRAGRPVQYSHLARELALWDAQTAFGGRPWSVETPSAARPLGWSTLNELKARGVALASVTHAAGLSATGDPAIDGALPLPERSEIPQATVEAVARARRVIAVGTSTARALEDNAVRHGTLTAACGMASLRIDAPHERRVADGILTGMHAAGSSHFDLLSAFAPRTLLSLAWSHAEDAGYLAEEFGDAMLVLGY